MGNIDVHIEGRVAQALEQSNFELKQKIEEQEKQIQKLTEHNRCYKETIDYLESQLKTTATDLMNSQMHLQESYSKSKKGV